jgi:peptidoglycan hydrolase-like protein with peptidoglycan-binding domain
MSQIIDLIGIAYRAYQRKDRILALIPRWQALISVAVANKALYDETLALAKEIVPGIAAPSSTYSVQWVQESLNKIGYHLDVDGKYGPATKSAIEMFQQDNGLVVDGWAGIETCAALLAKTG